MRIAGLLLAILLGGLHSNAYACPDGQFESHIVQPEQIPSIPNNAVQLRVDFKWGQRQAEFGDLFDVRLLDKQASDQFGPVIKIMFTGLNSCETMGLSSPPVTNPATPPIDWVESVFVVGYIDYIGANMRPVMMPAFYRYAVNRQPGELERINREFEGVYGPAQSPPFLHGSKLVLGLLLMGLVILYFRMNKHAK